MYDWLYLYNQFIAPLPQTYKDFIKAWHDVFPITIDVKVLEFKSMMFQKTSLGECYKKCETDEKFKSNLQFEYAKAFDNYEGSKALSHYHEAAYDAHMTGFVFAHVLKAKQIN